MTRFATLALAVLAAATAVLIGAGPAAAANPTATLFDAPEEASGITSGPDGNLWYLLGSNSRPYGVGKITTAGVASQVAQIRQRPHAITVGPDGNLWVASSNSSATGRARIVRITPAGVKTEFLDGISLGARPADIVAGPDGALWFTEAGLPQIGRIATDGTVTEYAVSGRLTGTLEIAVGADNRLWFTGVNSKRVGAITTGGVAEEFVTGLHGPVAPGPITLGPDGRVWVGASYINRQEILAVATDGTVERVTDAFAPGAQISALTLGPDGNVWGAEAGNGYLARITPAGAATELTAGLTGRFHYLRGIATGPDGNLWFNRGEQIGTISPVLESTTQPDTTIDSAPDPEIVTAARRATLDFEFEGTPGATLGCSFDYTRSPSIDPRPCDGSASYRVPATHRGYDFTFVLTAVLNGVVDSTPSIHRVHVERR